MTETTLLSLIVAAATVIFVFLAFKPISKAVKKSLTDKSHEIERELAHALHLKEEAQALLADFQRKQAKAEEEAKKIIDDARQKSRTLIEQASAELDLEIARKIKLAEQKIAQTEANTVKSIQDNVVNVTIESVRTLIKENITADSADKAVLTAIEDVKRKLH